MRNLPEILPGKYRLKYDMGIHKKVGLTSRKIKKVLKSDQTVDINKIKYLKYSVWGKIEDGWILLFMNHTFYIDL